MPYLTDLATAARKSGLRVVEVDGWKSNASPGGEDYQGILCHHTGSYDSLTDADNDLNYARWMAFTGRDDLDPPLCNLSLSAECVVYVCAAGNANHAGEARASGPMPAASDGSRIYVGIEAMNSGSQGWDSRGTDAHGQPVTQYEAYVRLCAALSEHYHWPATHTRAHRETSVTGKWDPGLLDMDQFRTDIATSMEDDFMPKYSEWDKADKAALSNDVADAVLREKVKVLGAKGEPVEVTVKQAIARIANTSRRVEGDVSDVLQQLDDLNADA